MSVSEELSRSKAVGLPALRFRLGWRTLLLLLGFSLSTVLLRLPTFFEPPWHVDEGIFSAVAQRVASGGLLYADAWESKPPLFLYIYVGLTELFGPGVLPLRIATAAAAIGTELALLGVALRLMSRRRALVAAAVLALLLAVPFWEGNLALADNFAILPSTLAVLCYLRGERVTRLGATSDEGRPLIDVSALPRETGSNLGWALLAGALFGAAFLIRPTAATVALALVLWLLISGQPWFSRGMLMMLGSAAVVLPVAAAFALFGSFYWFWDANVGFILQYVPSGEELPFRHRPLIVTPALVTVAALAWLRWRGETPRWSLPVLWLTFTLAAALLTGRPYSHYLVQTFPALALVIALLVPALDRFGKEQRARGSEHGWLSFIPGFAFLRPGSRLPLPEFAIAGAMVLLWLTVVMPAFSGNPFAMRYTKDPAYYVNFAGWAAGIKSTAAYNDYFDRRVNLTERLDATLAGLGASHEEAYIWGEVPWAYALADTQPSLRYMTSFDVLLIPYVDIHLGRWLIESDPRFIVVLNDAWPRIGDDTGILQRRYFNATRSLHSVLARRYEQVAVVGRARIFERTLERPIVVPKTELDN